MPQYPLRLIFNFMVGYMTFFFLTPLKPNLELSVKWTTLWKHGHIFLVVVTKLDM